MQESSPQEFSVELLGFTIYKCIKHQKIIPFFIFSFDWSILSSNLNSLSLVILEDLIRPFFPLMRDSKASLVTKVTVIIFGCVIFGMALFTSKLQISLDVRISYIKKNIYFKALILLFNYYGSLLWVWSAPWQE